MATATKTKVELTARQESNIWRKLRNHFLAFQDVLEEIISKQAWTSSGFASFSEAWAHHMSDITLAAEIRPHVVYQMLAEGLSIEEIAGAVKGVGADTAQSLSHQRESGVPAQLASLGGRKSKWFNNPKDTTTVKTHERKMPKAPDTLHVVLGIRKLQRVKRAADKLDITPAEFAAQAIEIRLAEVL